MEKTLHLPTVMYAILLLDCNSITTVRHGPKKWNVNYISASGISTEERQTWDVLYPEPESSTHSSDLAKEFDRVTRMLNTLEEFGYSVVSSCISQPRDVFKGDKNNRECYIWTLQKPKATRSLSKPCSLLKPEADASPALIEATQKPDGYTEDLDIESSQESLLSPMKRSSFILH